MKQARVNELAARSYRDAIELVSKEFPLCGNGGQRFALVLYPDKESPNGVNVITDGRIDQAERALLMAREQLLNDGGGGR